jgi:hypothetical protein
VGIKKSGVPVHAALFFRSFHDPHRSRHMDAGQIDPILDKLIREVESSIHAFYRGDVRQHTQRVKTDTFLREARQALLALSPSAEPEPGASASSISGGAQPASNSPLTPDENVAATRCVMGWMPMGPPTTASPQSRCVPAAREMAPTWGEREKARLALKRASA